MMIGYSICLLLHSHGELRLLDINFMSMAFWFIQAKNLAGINFVKRLYKQLNNFLTFFLESILFHMVGFD